MSSISFDRAAAYYDATRGYPPGVDAAIAAAIAAAAAADATTRFFEAGIGTGRIALPLIVAGYDYTGIDLAPLMVERLRAKLDAYAAAHPDFTPRVALSLGDATALPYPAGAFDVALTVHVMHLIPNWEAALDEILRVTRPGGWYLNCGDDFAANATKNHAQHVWTEIVRDLGFQAQDSRGIGAGRETINTALRQRGMAPEVLRTVTWDAPMTPAAEVARIGQRLWSRTWDVPDAIFAASLPRLDAAMRAQYGAAYEQPQPASGQFIITRARKL